MDTPTLFYATDLTDAKWPSSSQSCLTRTRAAHARTRVAAIELHRPLVCSQGSGEVVGDAVPIALADERLIAREIDAYARRDVTPGVPIGVLNRRRAAQRAAQLLVQAIDQAVQRLTRQYGIGVGLESGLVGHVALSSHP